MSLPPHGWHAETSADQHSLTEWVDLWWLLTDQPLERPVSLSLDPHDEVIVDYDQLRK